MWLRVLGFLVALVIIVLVDMTTWQGQEYDEDQD